jgi:hypothetical protein
MNKTIIAFLQSVPDATRMVLVFFKEYMNSIIVSRLLKSL